MKIDDVMYEILKEWVGMLQNDKEEEVIDEMMGLINAYEA